MGINQAGPGWIAKARKKHSREPGWRGRVTIGGVEYALSGWLKENEFNKPYLSLAVTRSSKQGS